MFIPRVPAPMLARALATSPMRLAHTQALRHPSSRTHSHLHPASSSSQAREAFRRPRASFSTTAQRKEYIPGIQRRVDRLPKEYVHAIQQELLQVMHKRPEVLSAVKEYMQVATNNGIDFPARAMPRNMTLHRFRTQKDISESRNKMILAFLTAGINIVSEAMVVSLMEMQHLVKDLE
ncbi:hypothetical protein LXA43DRAFT_500398 [Ganoderma leucocontextum]|nr:hypothetical protein LXA43DRAFT_500398 [Ganoderma leucocontextum]